MSSHKIGLTLKFEDSYKRTPTLSHNCCISIIRNDVSLALSFQQLIQNNNICIYVMTINYGIYQYHHVAVKDELIL